MFNELMVGVLVMRRTHNRRIEALIEVWSKIMSVNKSWSREEIINLLRDVYMKRRIEPLRGLSRPSDIYEKELASLFFVGKYGLGLLEDYKDVFYGALGFELKVEEVIEKIIEVNNASEAKKIISEFISTNNNSSIDGNTLAKILRIPFTGVILGFWPEEKFIKVINIISNAFPELESTLRKYVKFYIAFRTAEAIAKGELRSSKVKEAYKRALSVKLGFPKNVPGDHYVFTIAREVFNVNERVLQRVLPKIVKPSRRSRDLLNLSASPTD